LLGEHLEAPARPADITEPPVRLDEVAGPPQDPGFAHLAACERGLDPLEVFDGGLGPAVRWWTEQGFSLSVRKVTYSSSDMKVYPAMCRLG
jgi:hypothetical protein